jgi:mRNA interferase MazF
VSDYRYGSIWLINFEPQLGTEIKKTRPGLIISRTQFNQKRQKITVLPFTSSTSSIGGARIAVSSSDNNGLTKDSQLIVIDPATFDKRRFVKYLGVLETEIIIVMKQKLSLYLNLNK